MAPISAHRASWMSQATSDAHQLLGLAVSVFRRDAHESDDGEGDGSSSNKKTDIGKIVAIGTIVLAIICACLLIWGAHWYLGRRKVNKLVGKWTARRDVLTEELDDSASSIKEHSRPSTLHGHRVPEETHEGSRMPLLTNLSQREHVPHLSLPGGAHEIILASTPMEPQKKRANRPASSHSVNSLPGSTSSSITERQGVPPSNRVVLSYEPQRGIAETDSMRSPTELASPISLYSHSRVGRA